jgi:Ca-activated chloride channel homolog
MSANEPGSNESGSTAGEGMSASVLLDHEPVADGGWLVRALLRVEGHAPAAGDRVPLNLSLVLDRSGSMGGAPIAAAREAARLLVRRLSPEDTVSVVAFDDRVETVAEPATGAAQEDLPALIEGIDARGSTNLSGGWLKGRDHVAAGLRPGAVNRVILLTDGAANEGITEPETLYGLCSTAAAQGLTTTTIGFGPHFNENLLRGMADAGVGSTYYIEEPEQAPGVFEEELEGLLSLSAQNAQVRITPAAAVTAMTVLHTYPSSSDGAATVVELGDVYAREPRLLVMQFLLDAAIPDADTPVAELTVTAHVRTPGGGIDLRTIRMPVTVSAAYGAKVEPEVRREVLLLEAAQARREALERRKRGDYDGAASLLRSVADRLRESGESDAALREEVEDLATMSEQFTSHMVSEADAKYMHQRMYDTSRSRKMSLGRIQRRRPDADEPTP